MSATRIAQALTDAEPVSYWRAAIGECDDHPRLAGRQRADLVVVGAGFTGLWTAILAKERDPSTDVVLIDADVAAGAASGRNGGFVSDSLTHGLAHGVATWPDELSRLLRLGRGNLAELVEFVRAEGIDADLRLCGKTAVATREHEVAQLAESVRLHREYGEDVSLLDRDAVQADVHSPTYLAGMRVDSGGGLVDPARLAAGLIDAALRRGVRIHEHSRVTGLRREDGRVDVRTEHGSVASRRVVLATNAFRPTLRRLRPWIVPVYDHVLVTEPLSADQLAAVGWSQNQGMTDSGNQFHYYRRTPDDRILWGGYDAIYYYGSKTDAALEQRERSHRLLASQ
ncbi:MAG: FAD-binding oxidoreductase, partial [Actinomycetia bacterium]|nr:FAD-binding oxidoreductase [Actinomycetes bacterium]